MKNFQVSETRILLPNSLRFFLTRAITQELGIDLFIICLGEAGVWHATYRLRVSPNEENPAIKDASLTTYDLTLFYLVFEPTSATIADLGTSFQDGFILILSSHKDIEICGIQPPFFLFLFIFIFIVL